MDRRTNALPTDRQTDRKTDRPTDTASYRGALAHLKRIKERVNEIEIRNQEEKISDARIGIGQMASAALASASSFAFPSVVHFSLLFFISLRSINSLSCSDFLAIRRRLLESESRDLID